METLIIRRIASGDLGTFGVMVHNNIPFTLTLEREDLDNASNISCIPAGTYKCKRVQSPRFGNTFEVTNVPNRTHILFHKGNIDDNSLGCILVGEKFDPVLGSQGITNSKEGFNEFMDKVNGEMEFRLIIVNDFLTPLN